MKELQDKFAALNIEIIMISGDSPKVNQKFRKNKNIPFILLSDEDATTAQKYQIPLAKKHPKAWSYKNGFIQPAVFVYKKSEEVFRFIQTPAMKNLWGASGRPSPQEILDNITPKLQP